MLIQCVKIFKIKSYSMEFKSKKFFREFMTIIIYSEIPFNKNSYHIETSQLICKANELTGFYMTPVLTERSFRTDIKSYIL